jgi:hypothetical protein
LLTMAAAQTIVLKCGPKGGFFKMEKAEMTKAAELVVYTSFATKVGLPIDTGGH